MRVYISSDIEGTAGVSAWTQTEPGSQGYEEARRLMTGEVNAAIDGAFLGGATQVVVNDSHDGMRNLLLDLLDPRAELITGAPKPWSMVEGLDLGFDLMMCTGYHAMAGAVGNLAHTYSGIVHTVTLCGQPVGELALNAYYAGTFGVPVGAVCGDDVLEKEARALIPGLHFAQVKRACGRFGSHSQGAEKVRGTIREAFAAACRGLGDTKPLVLSTTPELVVTFPHAGQAQVASLCPGSERVSPVSVGFRHQDYREVLRAFRAMITLAAGA